MNIFIPDSWLRDFLETKAKPQELAEKLSLCSASVERVNRLGDDYVYEVEITTNRPDCLSVYGIARELVAILPRFGIPAKLHSLPNYQLPITNYRKDLPLEVKITDFSLCPRFTAVILDNVTIKSSPKIVQERLEKAGIRALNNVVDISNYLMLELGQPMHTFDYDKIKGAKMILRESARGEKITTLDGQTRPLPEGTIIIEDGEGRIIDLCGIMGGANSEVDENTKKVLLFVQTYDPVKIRQTCQQLSFRTEAASRFEKGIDPEGVMVAMKKATVMFEKNCGAKVASKLIDIYPNPPKQKTIKLELNLVNKIIGIEIPKNQIINILKSLGFSLITNYQLLITFSVPHWRHSDISLPEDLIEEIARIYGYHNLPSVLPTGEIPTIMPTQEFSWEEKIKEALKYWGFTEFYNYSLISSEALYKCGFPPEKYLKILNPLTSDLEYMRPSLLPSILLSISQNQANFEKMRIFELSKVYLPKRNDLPQEKSMLTGAITGGTFLETKGVVEALLEELGIFNYQIKPFTVGKNWHPGRTAVFRVENKFLGIVGEIHPQILEKFQIKEKVIVFDLDFEELVKKATTEKKYTPFPKYPPIIEELTVVAEKKILTTDLTESIKKVSPLIKKVELIDVYENARSFRLVYQSTTKTLTDKKVGEIRNSVIATLEKDLGVKIKKEF